MNRRGIAAFAVVCAFALAACSSSSGAGTTAEQSQTSGKSPASQASGSAAASADAKLKIGYIDDNEKIAFPHLVTLSIEKAAKQAGVDLVVCDPQGDAAKALQCAINMKEQKVQGLLNYQDNEKASPQICAQGPQVPVIAISIKQEPCQISFMGADNAQAGALGGQGVGQYVKQNFNCKYDAYISLEAPKAGALNADRMGGYRTAFEKVCGKIHDLHIIDTQGVADRARSGVTDTLTALPNAHRIIIVGINDSVILAGLAAATASNRSQDVFVSGQGLDPSGVCGMKNNPKQWVGDTAYFPDKYGDVVIPAIIKAVKGEKLPPLLPAELEFVTPTTVNQYYPDTKC